MSKEMCEYCAISQIPQVTPEPIWQWCTHRAKSAHESNFFNLQYCATVVMAWRSSKIRAALQRCWHVNLFRLLKHLLTASVRAPLSEDVFQCDWLTIHDDIDEIMLLFSIVSPPVFFHWMPTRMSALEITLHTCQRSPLSLFAYSLSTLDVYPFHIHQVNTYDFCVTFSIVIESDQSKATTNRRKKNLWEREKTKPVDIRLLVECVRDAQLRFDLP